MNDEKLIECVREHVVLYDLSNPKYMDTHAKNGIWVKIGAELNVHGSACKSRWYNIRDTYRKSLKRTATKSGRGAKNVKVYKYADRLGFLNRYLEEREPASNMCIQEALDEELHPENINENSNEHEETEDSIPEHNVQCTLQPPMAQSQPARKSSSVRPVAAKTLDPVRESASSKLMDYLIAKGNAPTTQQHPVDAFLTAMAPSLKTLSPYDWHLAKSDIFNTVQKYELKSIMGQQNYTAYDSSVSPSPSWTSVNSSESVLRDDT